MNTLKLTEINGAPEGFPPTWWVLKVEGVEKPVLLHNNYLCMNAELGLPPLKAGDEVEFEEGYPAYKGAEEFVFVKNFRVKSE